LNNKQKLLLCFTLLYGNKRKPANASHPLEVRARFRRASQNFSADFQNSHQTIISPPINNHPQNLNQTTQTPQNSSSPPFCVPKWHLPTVRKTKPPTWASTASTASSSATQEKKPALPVSLLPNSNVLFWEEVMSESMNINMSGKQGGN
jgi:hypothetical protein